MGCVWCGTCESAAEIARSYGIFVYSGRLSDILQSDVGERFDVVRFNHVLEHSLSPAERIVDGNVLLKSNGRLIVSGPNIDSAAFFLFQKYWSGLDLPRHLYDFTPVTLRRYCENANLQIQGEYYDGRVYDFIHSMRHFLQSVAVSGRNSACQVAESTKEETITPHFPRLSRIYAYIAIKTLVHHFNRRGLSDNYTVVAVPR